MRHMNRGIPVYSRMQQSLHCIRRLFCSHRTSTRQKLHTDSSILTRLKYLLVMAITNGLCNGVLRDSRTGTQTTAQSLRLNRMIGVRERINFRVQMWQVNKNCRYESHGNLVQQVPLFQAPPAESLNFHMKLSTARSHDSKFDKLAVKVNHPQKVKSTKN